MSKFLMDRGINRLRLKSLNDRGDAIERLARIAKRQEERDLRKKQLEEAKQEALAGNVDITPIVNDAFPEDYNMAEDSQIDESQLTLEANPTKSNDEIISTLFEPDAPLDEKTVPEKTVNNNAESIQTLEIVSPATEAVQASAVEVKRDHLIPFEKRNDCDSSQESEIELMITEIPKVQKKQLPFTISAPKPDFKRQMLLLAAKQVKERREIELEMKRQEIEVLKRKRHEKKAARVLQEQVMIKKQEEEENAKLQEPVWKKKERV
jgi:hypothetical protein